MSRMPLDISEKEEMKLVGFSVHASLNSIVENKIVGKIREDLAKRKNEVKNKEDEGIYLIQIYPECEWTPDVPYDHIVGIVVTSFTDIPTDMITHLVPKGRYAKFVHTGPESKIGNTYDLINEYSFRPFDIEYWNNIYELESPSSQIDIYIPVK